MTLAVFGVLGFCEIYHYVFLDMPSMVFWPLLKFLTCLTQLNVGPGPSLFYAPSLRHLLTD